MFLHEKKSWLLDNAGLTVRSEIHFKIDF